MHVTPKGSKPKSSHYNVLIVDDEEGTRNFLATLLMREAYHVSSVPNGKLALQRILSNQIAFDLVLCDVRTPIMSGIELLREVRQNNLNIPFIFISGLPTNQNISEAAALGVNTFLVKPLRTKIIIENIRNVLEKNKLETSA